MKIDELMSYTKAFSPSCDDTIAEELCEMFKLSLVQKVKTLSRGSD